MEPETLHLAPGERVPNSRLPVLIYRGVGAHNAREMLALFARNGWSQGWRNGIYPFHHFHSTAHEVLGIVGGEVDVTLGGDTGEIASLRAGDIVVLPAGTGHKRLTPAAGLDVVGAYPDGGDVDLIRADDVGPAIYAKALATIGALLNPGTDPMFGVAGPLPRLWRA